MNEKKILSTLLTSREAYDKVHDYLDENDFSAESNLILRNISEFYTADNNAPSVDMDVLLGRLQRGLNNEKQFTAIKTVVTNLPSASAPNITKELLELKRYSIGLKLSQALAGNRSEAVARYLDSYTKLFELTDLDITKDSDTQGLDIKTLMHRHFDREGLLYVAPKVLNEKLDGGARPGHHLLIFANTEVGKTLVAINMTAGFLNESKKVLYCGNEEPPCDLQLRLGTRLSGMTKREIEANLDLAAARIEQAGAENFILADLSPGTFYQIRKLVDKHKPDVVILDQLRNLDVKSEGRTQQLEKAATEARNLGKTHGVLVVSVTQAGDSASGKRVLSTGDVDGSNVGIPGQVDAMIGIGASEDEIRTGLRTISLPKNKIGGDHSHVPVKFEPEYSRIAEGVA